MRLLQYNNDGDFGLTEFFEGDVPKKYAILSHRWGAEEVTFKDLTNGTSKGKAGYGKIQFCGEQARRDGLQYFWVDTCCIDKSNAVELQEAINSMFRWYRGATKCYVYLLNISRPPTDLADGSNEASVLIFRKSEWFKRGWTFVAERFSWAASRETFRQEDNAYSLLGIFDVNMPLIYSEGKDKAMKRLREEIDKASKGFKREDFSVPFSLSDVSDVEHFVARKIELVEIHKALSGDGSRRLVVLHGLGEIGLWLGNMDTSEALDEVVDIVKAWLSLPNNTRWLMIYDNYDNPKLLSKTNPAAVDIRMFLPESYQGLIIITTRSSQVKLGHPIQIRKLGDVRNSLEILSTVSRQQELILDGLPLALATAGAYLDQTTRSFSDYLRLYKESWLRLMETSPELSSYEDRTLYSTWHISYESVKQKNPLSADLLRLWAYFGNQDLWFELLRHSDSRDPEWLRELTKDETIHALNQEWDCDLARLAVKSVGAHVPTKNDIQPWPMQLRLLQHAARCSYMVLNSLVVDEGLAYEYHNLGLLYADHGKLVEAEQMYQRALQGKEKAWGPDHTSTLSTVNNLGLLYTNQGKLVEAEQMYQRALQGKEKAWGPDHTWTLDTVNNLGILYTNQGKLVEAEQMYQRVLQGREKAWGLDHTSTLDTVNNLGILYKNQGNLVEAEQMYQRALQGKEKAWGPDHTSTLSTVNNLGILYKSQGRHMKSGQMHQRALAGYEKAFGPEHFLTLKTVAYLGHVFQARCYIAAKLSTRIIVLMYVKQLASLCLRFPRSRRKLFDYIGRAFAWIGDDGKSVAAFTHQFALSSPTYYAHYDNCAIDLSIDTNRLVCKVCDDGDLCQSCFENLNSNDLGAKSSHHSHSFLDLDGVSIRRLSLADDKIYSVSVEQWLKDIATL
ncbi:hypothetical protein IFR05_003081 [Cadophora sp. M221]|nr:hypothetical protein IFR05_003081 [Cadophora sp. M221]